MKRDSKFDFESASADLLASANAGRISITDFEAIAPAIASQIRQDRSSCLLPIWGMSSNKDEVVNQSIVDPKILATIGRLSNTKIGSKSIYHSGLMHTYGYLFSTVHTPYGFKRERWVNSKIEVGLGLPRNTISPFPSSGSLFSNVSILLSRIVSRDQALVTENCLANEGFDQRLLGFNISKFKCLRIIESLKNASGKTECDFRSDIVQFETRGLKGESLLVYSIQARGETPKIYTCFPILNESRNELVKLAKQGSGEIGPKYNSVIERIPDQPLVGSSKVIDF